ncbi:MAG TPA: DUF3943 domain-containing protein [Myxococcaceae bacterium]|nr:DUF3943 domain-containing protein [Myxococcaceae bacterium]
MARRGTWAAVTLATLLVGQAGTAQAEGEADTPLSMRETEAFHQRLATALDLGFYMAIGTVWYLLDDVNVRDRQYDWSFTTLKKKFLTREAFRFDDNTFGVNAPGHAIAGSLYFLSARTHGASTLEASATALLGSTAWELAVEYREVLSLNDVITTSVGGVALGETFFQVGEFFRRSKPTLVNRVLGVFLMGPSPLLPWDHRPPSAQHTLDSGGYPEDMWRRIHIGGGAELSRAAARAPWRSSALVDAHARTVDLAEYGHPGTSDPRWIGRALLADLHVRAAASPSGFDGLWLSAEALWSGMYGKTLRDQGGGPRGIEWLAGLSAIYDYHQMSPDHGRDRLEAVSPIGAFGHAAVHLGAPQLRFDASVYPVFAAVHSHAWQEIATDAREAAPDSLERDGYYFSMGTRAAGAIALEWGGWRVGASARGYALSSAEWMEVPAHASRMLLSDRRLSWEASLARNLMFAGMFAEVAVRNDAWWSRAENFSSVGAAPPSVVLQILHEL